MYPLTTVCGFPNILLLHWSITLLIIALSGLFLFLIYASASICSNVYVKSHCHGKRTGNHVAITFDDGPSDNTVKILGILNEHNIPATFFCIGENMEDKEDIVIKMLKNNHIIGNHSYSHSKFIDIYSSKKITNEIVRTNEIIQKYTKQKPLLFRPPFGVTNPPFRKAIKSTNMNVIGWSFRSLDTVRSEEKVLKKLDQKIRAGDIILLHDNSNFKESLLVNLISVLKQKNLEIVGIDQLLNIDPYEE